MLREPVFRVGVLHLVHESPRFVDSDVDGPDAHGGPPGRDFFHGKRKGTGGVWAQRDEHATGKCQRAGPGGLANEPNPAVQRPDGRVDLSGGGDERGDSGTIAPKGICTEADASQFLDLERDGDANSRSARRKAGFSFPTEDTFPPDSNKPRLPSPVDSEQER